MKLYLSSLSIPNKLAYLRLFDDIQKPRVAVIANAWGTYDAERSQPYIDNIVNLFKEMNIATERIDLLEYAGSKSSLDDALNDFDGVWVTGGNSYYLNWCMHESGFGKIIRKQCERGLVYDGESAGAIIAGPTLNYFQAMDNSNDAPELIVEGLKLTDIVVVPHTDNAKYSKVLDGLRSSLADDCFTVLPLTDSEAVVIRDSEIVKV